MPAGRITAVMKVYLGIGSAVDQALASMKRDGFYPRLAQKWGVP